MSANPAAQPRAVAELRLSHSQELCLDLIRICMAQFIVLVHFLHLSQNKTWLSQLPLSGMRVSVFFMLSGFLIFTTTWRRRHSDFTFRDFMLERVARLWVCLIPALIFSALVAHSVVDLPDYPAKYVTGPLQFVGNLLMLEDYPVFQILRRAGFDSPFFIGSYAGAEPYWTLPIEFYLYVVFGYLFFFGYLRRGRPSLFANALLTVASGAVVYHTATGPGDCLSLLWLIGCLGPWAVTADRKLQARFNCSDRVATLLVLAWIGLCVILLGLRGLSRGVDFYELQTAGFLAALMMGLIWLSGRLPLPIAPGFSSVARAIARQTYALYLTHNAVLTFYIAHNGIDFSLGEGLLLILACNLIAVPFYLLFDRHHRVVGERLKSLSWLGARMDMQRPTAS